MKLLGKDIVQPILIFSDESGTDPRNRYKSIGLVSGPKPVMRELNEICRRTLSEFGISEFKWKDIDKTEQISAAREIIPTVIGMPEVRVLVLVWDVHDRRHQINGRDDTRNFHHMLYHALRAKTAHYGKREIQWFPDEKTDLHHDILHEFLNVSSIGHAHRAQGRVLTIQDRVNITKCLQKDSRQQPLIGVTDLFAGAVRHSRDATEEVIRYRADHAYTTQAGLFEPPVVSEFLTRKQNARAEACMLIHEIGARHRQGIQLCPDLGLRTHRRGETQFWHYMPQHENDRAPRREKRHGERHLA